MSGGGWVKLGPCSFVSLYGVRRELWNMGWMRQAGGSCKRELVGVIERILKGPCRLGASLALVLRTRLPPAQAQDNEELVRLQVDADTGDLRLVDMFLNLEL